MGSQLRIAVVGGSIGGLTAACLLRDAGHDVTIYERSSTELEQRGAGIGFLETTYRYLVERADFQLDQMSIATDYIRYLNRDDTVAETFTHHYLFSSWNMVYRRLLAHWMEADDQGPERYCLGHGMTGFDQDEHTVTVHFTDRDSVEADLLVCADGVGSTARSILQPEADAGYAGYVAWRGMVHESAFAPDVRARITDAVTYYVLANSHILVYPIPGLDGSVTEGDRLINFVWYRNYLDGPEIDELMTDRRGVRRELSLPPGAAADHHVAEVKAFASARLPTLAAEVVNRTEEPFLQVVYDIEVDQMAFGRVALLGDAAYAARPHAAAGSAKAADDAWALARCLDQARVFEANSTSDSGRLDVIGALQTWEVDQLKLGRDLLQWTREVGTRSQITNTWQPGHPDTIFALHAPGKEPT